MTDLSKAFVCLDHESMIAKFDAYGFGYEASKLLHSYLKNRHQRVKVNHDYSSWNEITGVPQWSVLKWVGNNTLKANPDKYDLLLNEKDKTLSLSAGNHKICNSNNEKIIGVNFDNKSTFHDHVSELCKKASKKLHALSRISHCMNLKKRKIVMKAFIDS